MPQQASKLLHRYLKKEARELTSGGDGGRYVDFGVEIRTVRKSEDGTSPGSGLPKLVYVGEPLRIGGKLDRLTRKYVGPCDQWRVWLVGEKQREIIERFIGGQKPRNLLLYAAEGAGKTVLMAMLGWIAIFMATANQVPGALGATAPTHPRLGTLIKAVNDLGPVNSALERNPGAWGVYKTDAGDLHTVSGHLIQFRSTKKQSEAAGSPIQGWNWGLGALMDEGQDSIDAYEDVVARLRAGNEPPIVMTATAKDSSTWRDFRDGLSNNWAIDRIPFTATPFVHDGHWELLKAECSPREWERRGLALDVAPEKAIYSTWSRARNVRPIPRLGAVDVTARILAAKGWGHNFHMLIGHDPGNIQDVSILLKAYQERGRSRHDWYAVGEFVTHSTTTEEHCAALLSHLREEHYIQYAGPADAKALVIADPTSKHESRGQPHVTVYRTFQRMGFDIKSAAPQDSRVPQDARIEMLRRLICNANDDRRFFVEMADSGAPKCPQLVESIELQEYDAAGNAERANKSDKSKDKSDFTAATGYALWRLEREFGVASGLG